MIGSSYSDAVDSLPIPEGTDWCASMLREIASVMLATQRTIGAMVGDGSPIQLSGYSDWNSMFKRRAMIEAGSFTTSGTAFASQVVTFAQPNKFDGTPKVFIFERSPIAAAAGRGCRVTGITGTQFTVYAPYSTAQVIRYLAVDPAWDD